MDTFKRKGIVVLSYFPRVSESPLLCLGLLCVTRVVARLVTLASV